MIAEVERWPPTAFTPNPIAWPISQKGIEVVLQINSPLSDGFRIHTGKSGHVRGTSPAKYFRHHASDPPWLETSCRFLRIVTTVPSVNPLPTPRVSLLRIEESASQGTPRRSF